MKRRRAHSVPPPRAGSRSIVTSRKHDARITDMRGNGKKALTVQAETSRGCSRGRRTLATISGDVQRTLESRAQLKFPGQLRERIVTTTMAANMVKFWTVCTSASVDWSNWELCDTSVDLFSRTLILCKIIRIFLVK